MQSSETVPRAALPPPGGADDAEPGSSWWAKLLGPVILVVIAFCLVGVHVKAYTKIGPIDELQHIDYLYKAPSIVGAGERVGNDAMRQEACRGLDYDLPLPACSLTANYDPVYFQEQGYNTAYINSPLYYTATKVVAKGIGLVLGIDDLVTTGRLAGGFWLALGLLIGYAAGRRLGLGRIQLTAALAMIPAVQPLLFLSSTVTPDSMTMLVGALTIWAVVYWEERPGARWPILAAVGFFDLAVKQTNTLVIGVAMVYLLVRWWNARKMSGEPGRISGSLDTQPGIGDDPRLRAGTYLWGALILGVGAVVELVMWIFISTATQLIPAADIPMSQRFASASFPWNGLLVSIGRYTDIFGRLGPVAGDEGTARMVVRLVGPLLIGSLLAVLLVAKSNARMRAVSIGLLVGTILGAFALTLVGYFLQGSYFDLPDRYGYTLVPGMALCVAAVAYSRLGRNALTTLASLAVLVSIIRILVAV